MNEDVVNMEIRKFLKKVGITSQREIEKALQEADAAGKLAGGAPLRARTVAHHRGRDRDRVRSPSRPARAVRGVHRS